MLHAYGSKENIENSKLTSEQVNILTRITACKNYIADKSEFDKFKASITCVTEAAKGKGAAGGAEAAPSTQELQNRIYDELMKLRGQARVSIDGIRDENLCLNYSKFTKTPIGDDEYPVFHRQDYKIMISPKGTTKIEAYDLETSKWIPAEKWSLTFDEDNELRVIWDLSGARKQIDASFSKFK